VNVRGCIEQALGMAQNEIRHRARLVKDYADLPPVLATEGRLVRVFLNRFVNAAHAIKVGDTGKGIAPKIHAKVFEPLFTTNGAGKEAGLGLVISRSIVEGFGGEIDFLSEVGKGTRFVIKLPRSPRRGSLSTHRGHHQHPRPRRQGRPRGARRRSPGRSRGGFRM
jgi:signal transduction histidine kinase